MLHQAEQFSRQAILGRTDYINPYTGEQRDLPITSGYYWQDQYGNILETEFSDPPGRPDDYTQVVEK